MKKHNLYMPWAKKLLAFSLAISASLAITGVSNADVVIFDATTSNTTLFNNNGAGTISGATPDLLVTNTAANNNINGFASTADINTLLGTPLTANDTVTIAVTIDSLTAGTLRSNGVEFGLGSTDAFRPAGSLLLGQAGSNSGSDVRIVDGSFQDAGTLDFNSNQGAIVDGVTLTLTANSAGYSFSLTDILVAGSTNPSYTDGATSAVISGTFTGTEFVDNFGTGHLYVAVQSQNSALVADYSSATISVATAVPEPSSLALLGIGAIGFCGFRRRS